MYLYVFLRKTLLFIMIKVMIKVMINITPVLALRNHVAFESILEHVVETMSHLKAFWNQAIQAIHFDVAIQAIQ